MMWQSSHESCLKRIVSERSLQTNSFNENILHENICHHEISWNFLSKKQFKPHRQNSMLFIKFSIQFARFFPPQISRRLFIYHQIIYSNELQCENSGDLITTQIEKHPITFYTSSFIYCRIEKFNRNTSERIKNTNRKQMCYAVIC